MIKVKLTENYTGFNIEGTYDDFNELYDSIFNMVGYEEVKDELEENMRLHILGFQYDLRHAYQGDRYVKSVDNGLTDEEKEYYGIKKSVKQDILYSFDYVVPELLLDILIFRYFVMKKSKEINEFNVDYNNVITFYSKVVESLNMILTPIQHKKIKKLLMESVISEKYFLRQWFDMISIDYINMTKNKRKKEIMHIIDAICNWYLYEDYKEMSDTVYKCAKEHNCRVSDVEYREYPHEIIW